MINTVTGKINISDLGSVLCHEHIICCNTSMRNAFGENYFSTKAVTEKAISMLKDAKKAGVDTIIDATTIDLGRDVLLLKEVSEKSGVNIIASSGLYYSEEPTFLDKPASQIAKHFVAECEKCISGTNILPGMLKCATGRFGISDVNKNLLEAMAIVQKETSLPLTCHNEHSQKTAYGQIEVFEKNNVNLEKIIIGHASDSYDIPYLEDLLKSGVCLAFDRIFPGAYQKQALTIMELISKGYENKLSVSHDFFIFLDFGNRDFETFGKTDTGRDFCTVHKKLFPELKKLGATDSQIHKLTHENVYKLLEV